MKNLLSGLCAIITFLAVSCTDFGGDIDLGDTSVTLHIEYGDSIVTNNGPIINWNGDIKTWQYTDNSNTTWDVTVNNNTTFIYGNQINGSTVSYVFDNSTNTLFHWDGNTWIANNQQYYYNNSTHTFVVIKNYGDVITLSGNAVYIGGDVVTNNTVYDSSTTTVFTYHISVQGNYWTGVNVTTNNSNFYTFNTTTNTWTVINNNNVHIWNGCCVPCGTDTLVKIVTVYVTLTDTITKLDTIVLIIPEGYRAIALHRMEDSWLRMKGICMPAIAFATGGPDTLNSAFWWGGPTFGTAELLGLTADGNYRIRTQSLTANKTLEVVANDSTTSNVPLAGAGISDCMMGNGPLYNQFVNVTVPGNQNPLPTAWTLTNSYDLKFQWHPNAGQSTVNFVPLTNEVKAMFSAPGSPACTVDGWVLMPEKNAAGQLTKYLNVGKTGVVHDDVINYVLN